MKILLYVNPDKDKNGKYFNRIKTLFYKHGLEFDLLTDDLKIDRDSYSAMFVIGGDGTLLRRTEIACLNDIPIIGINIGRLGFLTEFEIDETEDAITLFKSGKLVKDERLTLKIQYRDKTYYALNDASFSRLYEENTRMVVNLGIKIGSAKMRTLIGDGAVIATPTGSTAYSLAAGGPIIEPNEDVICVTPLAAHSFSARSIVCSAHNPCSITHEGGANVGLFVDGKLVETLKEKDVVSVSRAERKTVFLRKDGFDFFSRLNKKLQDR